MTKDEILTRVNAALEREPRINLHRFPIKLDFSDGGLTLTGEVENIIAKRLAFRLAHAAGVDSVHDDLRIVPQVPRSDREIARDFGESLLGEADLRNCGIRDETPPQGTTLHAAEDPDRSGDLCFTVSDGAITLEGHMISLSHRRLAELLAWWTPGSRQVHNRLHVTPPEEDGAEELRDAVVLALELDPRVPATQVAVGTSDHEVILGGLVTREDERLRAELDAWYIPGVHDVINRIEVRPGG